MWTGVVLAGGASTRMGRDKALIQVDGTPMACRVADALAAAGASEVLCIGGDEHTLRAAGLDHRADEDPGAGPLAAVVTALHHAAHDVVFIGACDLLDPDAEAIRATVDALADHDAAVPTDGTNAQPLHAAYNRSASGPRGRARRRRTIDHTRPRPPARRRGEGHRRRRPPRCRYAHRSGAPVASSRMDEVIEIDVDELASLRAAGVPLIDVRRPDEYEEYHVPGARLIPMAEIEGRLDEVPKETVYVICAVGSRSRRVAAFLREQGFDAVNVAGGSKAWAEGGFPVEVGPGESGTGS